ncbi:hypothetical protein ACLOJK_000284 [Asimina triloba]
MEPPSPLERLACYSSLLPQSPYNFLLSNLAAQNESTSLAKWPYSPPHTNRTRLLLSSLFAEDVNCLDELLTAAFGGPSRYLLCCQVASSEIPSATRFRFCSNGPPAATAIVTVPDAISSHPRLCSSVVGIDPSTPLRPLHPSPTQTLAALAPLLASHWHPASCSRRPQAIHPAARKFVRLWFAQIHPRQFARPGHQQRLLPAETHPRFRHLLGPRATSVSDRRVHHPTLVDNHSKPISSPLSSARSPASEHQRSVIFVGSICPGPTTSATATSASELKTTRPNRPLRASSSGGSPSRPRFQIRCLPASSRLAHPRSQICLANNVDDRQPPSALNRCPPSAIDRRCTAVRWILPLGKKVEHHNTVLQRHTYFGVPSASFGTPAAYSDDVHTHAFCVLQWCTRFAAVTSAVVLGCPNMGNNQATSELSLNASFYRRRPSTVTGGAL